MLDVFGQSLKSRVYACWSICPRNDLGMRKYVFGM